MLSKPMYFKPMLIMLALMFFQQVRVWHYKIQKPERETLHFPSQFSGINAVLFYLTDIFKKADTGLSEGLSATIVTLVQVIATGIAALIVDRFGRKILLIISDAAMCVSILGLGIFFYFDEHSDYPVVRHKFGLALYKDLTEPNLLFSPAPFTTPPSRCLARPPQIAPSSKETSQTTSLQT